VTPEASARWRDADTSQRIPNMDAVPGGEQRPTRTHSEQLDRVRTSTSSTTDAELQGGSTIIWDGID